MAQLLDYNVQRVQELWDKAWGHPWPNQSTRNITLTDISPDEDVPMLAESDDDHRTVTPAHSSIKDEWEYTVLLNIKSVVAACGGTARSIEDALIVRPEYTWLINTMEHGYLRNRNTMVVTGQPGIGPYSGSVCAPECADVSAGKTVFLIYLLLYRLERMLPTAIQFSNDSYIVFDADGAAVGSTHIPWYCDRQYWALADSNEELFIPCGPFRRSGARLIQASSPRPDTWKDWTKYRSGRIVVSELPSPLEIGAIL